MPRLADALAHAELAVTRITEDAQRPRFHCRVVRLDSHAPFGGFNRAQAAVIEAAILVSRLHMLPREKIESEMAYLEIAVGQDRGSGGTGGVGLVDGKDSRLLRKQNARTP